MGVILYVLIIFAIANLYFFLFYKKINYKRNMLLLFTILFTISIIINLVENTGFSKNDFLLLTLIYPITSLILFIVHYLLVRFDFVKNYQSYILFFSISAFIILAFYGYTLAAAFDR